MLISTALKENFMKVLKAYYILEIVDFRNNCLGFGFGIHLHNRENWPLISTAEQ